MAMASTSPAALSLPSVKSARGAGLVGGGIFFLADMLCETTPVPPLPRASSIEESFLPLLGGAPVAAPCAAAATQASPPLVPSPPSGRPRGRPRPQVARAAARATFSGTLPDISGGPVPAEVPAPAAPPGGPRAPGGGPAAAASASRATWPRTQGQQVANKEDPARPESAESHTSVSELICNQATIYRGRRLERGIQRFRAKQSESALYRREVAKVEARIQRAVAREHMRARRQSRAVERGVKPHVLSPLQCPALPRRSVTGSERPSDSSSDHGFGEDPEEPEIAADDQIGQGRKKSSVLGRLSLQTSSKDRVRRLTKLARKRMTGTRQQDQLEALPAERRLELKAAFKAFRLDAGRSATRAIMLRRTSVRGTIFETDGEGATMEVSRLCAALEVLGQEPRSDLERRGVQDLCIEFLELGPINFYTFCCVVLPRVQDAMLEVHRFGYKEKFDLLDTGKTGLVGEDACLDILEVMCAENMNQEGLEMLKTGFSELFEAKRKPETDCVDFEAFLAIMLWARTRLHALRKEITHRICIEEELSVREIRDYRHELVRLYEVFCIHKDEDTDCLRTDSLLSALIACGLVASKGNARQCVEDLVRTCVEQDCNLSFSEFLGFIQHVRCQSQESMRSDLEEAFRKYDKDGNRELSKLEAYALFSERDLNPRSRHDQEDIAKLLKEVDSDNSGSIDFEEFEDLIQRLSEKKRLFQHLSERRLGRKLGFSDVQMASLREAFFLLDVNGDDQLSLVECKQLFASKLQPEFRGGDLKILFDSFDADDSTTLDFQEFLRFFAQLSERLDKLAGNGKFRS